MKTTSVLPRAAAFFLAFSQVVTAAPQITRSLISNPLFTRQSFTECGRDSEGGNKSCALGTCCSYYGYCGTTSAYCDSPDSSAPCQVGFGACKSVTPPSCTGTSATARKVGYYLSYATTRSCDAVTPSNLVTTGFTHINFAFALFDNINFNFYPQKDGDEALYSSFTALKSSTLQTWIAIGGGDFNNPSASTKTYWSTMTSTAANRAKWISNLTTFMSKYGFQGVDLDWEWPGDTTRGGTSSDAANFVLLVKEMKTAFAGKYGISSALVTDYAALKYTDVKGMEPYLDWFNFMSYDYHTPLMSPTTSDRPLSHTSTVETDAKLGLLWAAGIPPAKVNMGLAYYGMSYTMASSSCMTVNCAYTGPGTAGACIKVAGHLSNKEVKRIITAGGTASTLISDAMVKQTTYGTNQLVLHDDDDTYALKTKFASSRCLGGTMVWSIDQ